MISGPAIPPLRLLARLRAGVPGIRGLVGGPRRQRHRGRPEDAEPSKKGQAAAGICEFQANDDPALKLVIYTGRPATDGDGWLSTRQREPKAPRNPVFLRVLLIDSNPILTGSVLTIGAKNAGEGSAAQCNRCNAQQPCSEFTRFGLSVTSP